MQTIDPDGLDRSPTAEIPQLRGLLGWSDFQLVLVVAQIGQLSRACEVLAISHVTLLRKLAAIETRLKVRLFDRVRGHCHPTAAGAELVAAAEGMAPLAQDAELRVMGQDLRPSGHVRVTAAGILVSQLVLPVLRQFAQAFPDVTLEFTASRDHHSLTRREADVALRVSDSVPDWLIGRQLGQVDFAIYGQRRPRKPIPLQPLAKLLDQKRWVAFERDARDLKFDRWLADHLPDRSVVIRADGFDQALAMVRAGLGIALLPTFVAASCPDIEPLSAEIRALRTPLWLITHKDLRGTMRVKVLMQAVGPALAHALKAASAAAG
jgi:DNA-binding transcriptional LysR family regulator